MTTQAIIDRVRAGAREVIQAYRDEVARGGEPDFPQSAADVIWLCGEYERLNLLKTQIGPTDV